MPSWPDGNILGQGQEQVLSGQLEGRGFFGVGHNDAVITDLDFNNIADAVFEIFFQLALFDPTGRVGDVGMLNAHACAETFVTAAGTGGFDFRGFKRGGFSELLGHNCGKGINRGRSDDGNVIPGGCGINIGQAQADNSGQGGE